MNRNRIKRYQAALDYATHKHEGQMRIGGDPYITHPIAVAEIVRDWGYGSSYQIVALFHDLLEDTDATEEALRDIGGSRVLAAVRRLTKTPGYNMPQYVAGIKKSKLARVVKAADRLHNLRCATVADETFKRRYVLESLRWYLDLSPAILPAVQALAATMQCAPPELTRLDTSEP